MKRENITLAVVIVVILGLFGWAFLHQEYMVRVMGGFFVVVGLLKVFDLEGFASSFTKYDIVAKRWNPYARAYPFIELLLGGLFLLEFQVKFVALLTAVLMSIGTVGVARNLFSKNQVRCACLGTLINLPLTKFTLVEDVLMVIMAVMIYARF